MTSMKCINYHLHLEGNSKESLAQAQFNEWQKFREGWI